MLARRSLFQPRLARQLWFSSTTQTPPPSSSSAPPPTDDKEKTDAEVKLEECQKELKETKNNFLRALADAENLRDRTRREKEQAQQLAIRSFAKDLVTIPDILEMALESVPKDALGDKNLNNLYEGLNMTLSELKNTFKRNGLEQFSPQVGDTFDPALHQAMFMVPPSEKHLPGQVFQTTKSGYKLNNFVLRAAQVGVVNQQ